MSITLTLLGTGGPRPDPQRCQTSFLVDVDGERILVDCGDGALRRLLASGTAPESVSALIFTHLHADHTLGYAAFVHAAWFGGRRHLPVIGPTGTQALTENLFQQAFAPDIRLRAKAGNPGQQFVDVAVTETEANGTWLETDGCQVTAQRVYHNGPSNTYALRFTDQSGHVAVISSDTAYCEPLIDFAGGAHLLVHEAYLCGATYEQWDPAYQDFLRRVHVTPAEAGEVARRCGAGRLVLTHFLTGIDEAAVVTQAGSQYAGPVVAGRDLMAFSVP